MNIANMIDHTLLKPEATEDMIENYVVKLRNVALQQLR